MLSVEGNVVLASLQSGWSYQYFLKHLCSLSLMLLFILDDVMPSVGPGPIGFILVADLLITLYARIFWYPSYLHLVLI